MLPQNEAFIAVHVNSIDPFIPEIWARESIAILEERMVMGMLVHRDFSDEIAQFGDTVHTRKPAEFSSYRKDVDDEVTVQDASATNVAVVLDQHIHTTFIIKDGEETKSFKDLVETYLEPAMIANARVLDRALCGQVMGFLANSVGALGLLSSSTAHDYLVNTRKQLNLTKAHQQGRNLILSASAEAEMLKTDLFISAERVGDDGSAMREASLGRKFGLNTFMDLNAGEASGVITETATTSTEPTAIGDTLVVAASATDLVAGTYFTLVGDMSPLRVASIATLDITTVRPTIGATLDDAVLLPMAMGKVDLAADYVAGWTKHIHVDDGSFSPVPAPQVGQLVSFTSSSVLHAEYMIIDVVRGTVAVPSDSGDDYDILLDRPIEAALTDNDNVNYGPSGSFSLAFHRNAIALINRPIALPRTGTGARSALASHNGLSMRITMSYDGYKQGTLVTVDGLFGIKILDTDLGAVMLG